uniref:Uncharacterized protein n=1 Tax=Arundo donax TaxID=35708 RepID=A0A0A9AEE2_ARUDO
MQNMASLKSTGRSQVHLTPIFACVQLGRLYRNCEPRKTVVLMFLRNQKIIKRILNSIQRSDCLLLL